MIEESGDPIQKSELIRLHPRLFHMASAGSWESIQRFGLLTTNEIVTSSGISARDADDFLSRKRPESVFIEHPDLGTVSIRDQRPLRIPFLEPKLVDMTVEDWIRTLNDHVFFWPTPEKLDGLLNAQMYRAREQDVLTIDTASLLSSVGSNVRLSPINSGAALYPNAAFRGSETFQAVETYDYEARRRARGAADAIVELAVLGGVRDISRHVVTVERRRGPDLIREL